MKFSKSLFGLALAMIAGIAFAEVQPHIHQVLGLVDHSTLVMGAITSLAGLKNLADQLPNPPGGRRVFAVLAADLDDAVIDWPRIADITASECTVAIPVKAGKTLAVITPAENSLDATFENQGDRNYMAYKHAIMFDIAGLSQTQLTEAAKFMNAGCIFLVEEHDETVKIYGTKLNPITLKQKGQLGKKGGDKKGMSFSGDNDSFMFAPPIYKTTLALPLPV
ncbi:hypothetical protein GCM10028803_53400 [Larkinella knui]|uniref:FAS1 domain-containing protein n=1 Tax=Larkinella knui TaxID=2025310 RepID=A0A3P1CGH0_9BACT|nr:hypothetical protein [Larkinella knui]RRB12453.1 hypothetical protein EHT87_19840 [Larkinella knui]